jgi:uncharacterized protein
MQYKQASLGRIFILKFDHEDDLLDRLKHFALKEKIKLATITFLGALYKGDIVTGPRKPVIPPEPNEISFNDVWETIGFGIITNSDEVHIHASFGKNEKALTGCLRKNCEVFATVEAVVTELTGVDAERKIDKQTHLKLLSF